jgi:hypothetical protein
LLLELDKKPPNAFVSRRSARDTLFDVEAEASMLAAVALFMDRDNSRVSCDWDIWVEATSLSAATATS